MLCQSSQGACFGAIPGLVDRGIFPYIVYVIRRDAPVTCSPSMTPLESLRALNGSSPQFPNRFAIFLSDDKVFKDSIRNLQDDDAAWLIEYLDTVRNSSTT